MHERGLRRLALFAGVVAVHLAIVLWIVRVLPAEPKRLAPRELLVEVVSKHGIRPNRVTRTPGKANEAATLVPVPTPLVENARSDLALRKRDSRPALPAVASGEECHVPADVGIAIRNDPAAMAELAAFPPGIRTEADAVMLWNGQWVDDPGATAVFDHPPVAEALRRTVVAIVAGAPSSCRDAPVTGPVFVPIAEPKRTTMLVIGSGQWRWADVVANTPECGAASNSGCPISTVATGDRPTNLTYSK